MAKRGVKKKVRSSRNNYHPTKHKHHPIFRQKLTIGQKASDFIANFGGSWRFVLILIFFLLSWLTVNIWLLTKVPFDPYPFILLNLVLSCLAAFQAPIILMAQNRQGERDRIDAKYDHAVNRRASREIMTIRKNLDSIRRMIEKKHGK